MQIDWTYNQPLPNDIEPPKIPVALEDKVVILVHIPEQGWKMQVYTIDKNKLSLLPPIIGTVEFETSADSF